MRLADPQHSGITSKRLGKARNALLTVKPPLGTVMTGVCSLMPVTNTVTAAVPVSLPGGDTPWSVASTCTDIKHSYVFRIIPKSSR